MVEKPQFKKIFEAGIFENIKNFRLSENLRFVEKKRELVYMWVQKYTCFVGFVAEFMAVYPQRHSRLIYVLR